MKPRSQAHSSSMLAVWLKTVSLFGRREHVTIGVLFVCSVAINLVNLAGIASVMPFIAVLTTPDLVDKHPLVAWLYHALGFESRRSFVIALGVGSFIILLVSHVLELTYAWVSVRFINLKEYELSTDLLRSYLMQDFEATSSRNTAELSKNILQDVENVITGILFSGMNIVDSVISATLVIGLLLYMDPLVTVLVAGVFVVSYGLIFRYLSPLIRQLGREVKELYAQMYISTQQALDGLKEVKANNREPFFIRNYAVPRKASAINYILFTTTEMVPKQLLEVTAFGTVIAVSVYFVYDAVTPGLHYAMIAMFAFAAYRVVPLVKGVFDGLESFNYYRSFIDEMRDDLDQIDRHRGAAASTHRRIGPIRSIELRAVHFRYRSRSEPALDGVDFKLCTGERVCLIGPSGAGKTTTLDIVLGLLSPASGSLLINGEPVSMGDYAAVRDRIGYVPQNPYLLDDSLQRNIVFGDDVVDTGRLAWAFAMADLAEIFGDDPETALATGVGQHGGRLSGGQRQRIAIARALYRKPDVLIFDESTNGLDLATEHRLLDRLRMLDDVAILFVSHRPSVMKACDRIIALEKGTVAGSGTFEELANSEHLGNLLR